MKDVRAKLSMGPVLFNWPANRWRDFYFRIADEAPVDTVCIGETVCSKRVPFHAPHMPEVIERLQNAGKEVVLSTLGLVMSEREMRALRETVEGTEDLLIEANDISAVALLRGRAHVIGPMINVYNEGTLDYLVRGGARRVVLPVELSAASVGVLAAHGGAELEVFAFGRLPLAISARCYHARSHDLSKDNCQFVCDRDADGMDLDTLDGEAFLAVNGVQTLSYSYCNLIGDLDHLCEIGVGRFRLSPHSGDMVRIAAAFRDVLDGRIGVAEADDIIAAEIGDMPVSNGYLHGAEGVALKGPLAHLPME